MTLSFAVSGSSMAIANILKTTSSDLQKSMRRLATGLKINSSADGSADMAIGINMESQVRGFDVASANVQQGIGVLSTADSALQDITSHLQNIRDIAVAAGNSTNTTATFASYTSQLTAELASINNIATTTKSDTNVLLDGTVAAGAGYTIQIGPNSADTLDIKAAFTNNQTAAAGLNVTQATIASTANAGTLLTQVDAALSAATANLSTIGGYENRLSDHLNYLSVAKSNTAAAEGSIRNTDVAQETANLTRLQILQQAGVYALSQANTAPQTALALLPH